jgi:hypothetical protein
LNKKKISFTKNKNTKTIKVSLPTYTLEVAYNGAENNVPKA